MRVRREAQAMASLGDHPNIVGVYDVGEQGAQLYIVSEYMSGGDLEALLAAAPERQLPIDEVRRIAEQVDIADFGSHTNTRARRPGDPALP